MNREYRKFLTEFRTYLEHYKAATGKTQKQIAKDSGLSQNCISVNLRGLVKPSSQTLFLILQATGRGDVLGEGKLGIRIHEVSKRKSA